MSLRKKTSERFGGGCWKRIHSKKEEEEERTRLRSVGGKVGGSESTHSSFFLPCPKHRPARPTMPYDTDKDVFLPRKRVFWPKIRLKFHIFLCLNIIRANLWGQRPETSSLPFSRDGPCVGGRGKRRRRPMTHTRTHTHEVQGREGTGHDSQPKNEKNPTCFFFLRRLFDIKLAEASLKSFNAPKYNPQFWDYSPPLSMGRYALAARLLSLPNGLFTWPSKEGRRNSGQTFSSGKGSS